MRDLNISRRIIDMVLIVAIATTLFANARLVNELASIQMLSAVTVN